MGRSVVEGDWGLLDQQVLDYSVVVVGLSRVSCLAVVEGSDWLDHLVLVEVWGSLGRWDLAEALELPDRLEVILDQARVPLESLLVPLAPQVNREHGVDPLRFEKLKPGQSSALAVVE